VSDSEDFILPYLVPEADVETINTAFHYNSVNTGHLPIYQELSFFDDYKSQDQQFTYRKDERIDDLLKLYLIALKDHIELDTAKVYGSIQLGLLEYNERNSDALMMANIFLLGIPSFFGAPVSIARSHMEITLTISNSEKKALRIYTGKGHAVEYRALYWGYGKDVYRVASLKAFRMALVEAVKKMRYDQEDLITQLRN
jgi:hypothetical protein